VAFAENAVVCEGLEEELRALLERPREPALQ
jgi:hypothetical protein